MNNLIEEVSQLLYRIFASDQTSYASQQSDGSYRRKTGLVSPHFLAANLRNKGSLAIYQRNNDQTVKWICYDFDILKHNFGTERHEKANFELNQTVSTFCESLNNFDIPYLLEFSGNRGFHVWITFKERTDYQVAFLALQTIRDKTNLQYDKTLVGIDIFPSCRNPSGGVGKAVKIPLSKHTKSQYYSVLLNAMPQAPDISIGELSAKMLQDQIAILSTHISTTKSELQTRLSVFLPSSSIDTEIQHRIKSIKVRPSGFSLHELLDHWQAHPPLAFFSKLIRSNDHLNHSQRRLLVGMLGNVKCDNRGSTFSRKLLHKLMSNSSNYNEEITERAINSLVSFNFPTQEQIEESVGRKFDKEMQVKLLLSACVPKYVSHEDATFDIAKRDVEIVRISEIKYLYANDEVQARAVVDGLANRTAEELLSGVQQIIQKPSIARFYKHVRNEKTKDRILVTPDAFTRTATSCILKQILYFLDFPFSGYSHGYQPNKGFYGGYIFKPWLYLWIKFVSNISSAIKNKSNEKYFIVKTDISAFYDKIPHDNLKRLLLGDVNKRVDTKLNRLENISRKTYEKYIDVLFVITEMMVEGKKGLPQGPAYARYLAELYLDNLDRHFEKYLHDGTLYLYQRYVDDIFFIASSESSAITILENLKQILALLGLSLNAEKTIISKIANFDDDFNSYRSQSKYAVDRASRDFANATETQKNLAINEFMSLVQSDGCEEDLAFVFSHLTGVENVESIKKDMVLPTIKSGIGRGSLYKHLFGFVLADSANWQLLESVRQYTELQSEVLTACLINEFEENKKRVVKLRELTEKVIPSLDISRLVEEHLVFLHVTYKIRLDLNKINPESIIRCLAAINNGETLHVSSSLISNLNTPLNNLKDLHSFVNAMYPLCTSIHIQREDLNRLALTFYAKLANDEEKNRLSSNVHLLVRDSATTSKFYYLLCLFSLSVVNTSIMLLKSMWKCCVELFNHYGPVDSSVVSPNWFAKINSISLHTEKMQLVISSIIDGNIFRGLSDKYRVFESFHNNLLIFIAFQGDDLYRRRIEDALASLKDCGEFYKWIADREGVTLFPNAENRKWFEKNVIENGTIALRRNNQVLFRKPTEAFHPSSKPINTYKGYSELLETYNPDQLKSISDIANTTDPKLLLEKILETTVIYQDMGRYPNVFVGEKLINPDTWRPFSEEFIGSRTLIFEDSDGKIQTFPNTTKNFIRCCLKTISEQGMDSFFQRLEGKYLPNLGDSINIVKFLQVIADQLRDMTESLNEFYFDLAVAASVFQMMGEFDPVKRIEKFVEQYHKINPKASDKHIYGVIQSKEPKDLNPLDLLKTVEEALRVIRIELLPALAFFLDKDVEHYQHSLITTAQNVTNRDGIAYLSLFRRANLKIYHTAGELAIDDEKFSFDAAWLLNGVNKEFVAFESQYSTLLNSSEHVYWQKIDNKAHLVAIPHSVSKIYQSITERYNIVKNDQTFLKSFPDKPVDAQRIKKLSGFHNAAEVVRIHQELSPSAAQDVLSNWLRYLPKDLQVPLITLISSHVVMNVAEINGFIKAVNNMRISPTGNLFLIKRPGDFNGAHRILQRDPELGRFLKTLSPANLSKNEKDITIVTDNLLSGSQITKALSYYCTENAEKIRDGYFPLDHNQKQKFRDVIKNVDKIALCTVLYTNQGKNKIKDFLQKEFDRDFEITVSCGRDISNDAFFGSSERMGEADKENLRRIFKCERTMLRLRSRLDVHQTTKKFSYKSDAQIDKMNLVARYKSLPKKCFPFLHIGLRHDCDCHPFVLVRETYAMNCS